MCDVPQPCGGAAAVRQAAEQGKAPEEDRSARRNAIAKAVEVARAAMMMMSFICSCRNKI